MEKVDSLATTGNISWTRAPGLTRAPSRIPVYACGLALWTQLARIHEILPGLQPLRPALSSLLLAIGLCVLSGRCGDRAALRSRETRYAVLFWLLATLCIPFSVWKGGAFEVWRHTITSNTLFFFCILLGSRTQRDLRTLWSATIMSAAILAAGALFVPGDSHRMTATAAYDPNDFAFVLVCLLPLVVCRHAMVHGIRRLLLLALAALLLILVLRTESRGGFIGLVLLGLFFLFSPASGIPGYKRFVLCALGALLVFLLSPDALWQRLSDLLSGQDYNLQTDLSTGRLAIWKRGIAELVEHPLLGVGTGQYATVMGQQYGSRAWLVAHNSFLQVGVEMGIPALLLFCIILLRIRRNSRPATRSPHVETRALAFGVHQSLIIYATCGLFLSQAYSPILWLLLCFSFRLHREAGKGAGSC